MKNLKAHLSLLLLYILVMVGCKTDPPKPEVVDKPKGLVAAPNFNSDSAFVYIETQVNFGPRVPNSEAHELTKNWLANKLNTFADTIYLQNADLKAFDGSILKSTNIIGVFNPQATQRVLLAAHWDTRPFADQDLTNTASPIDGANDGGSGVGVLLEIARLLKEQPVNVGVDIIFFDAEDFGQPSFSNLPPVPDSYCLGSQYWAANTHVPNYKANFGILLDMVGGYNATFTHEGTSVYFAKNELNKVWGIAKAIGYSDYFSFEETNPITDDHFYINRIANIPTIDIIEYDRSTPSGFGHYWHTHKDNMEVIDKNTLKAVGQTVTQTIYQFNSGNF